MDRDRIKNIMQEQGILPQSRFGQNFLCDEKIIQSIVELCEIKKEDRVLEIGPGLGSLTFPLSELGCDLTCVEIDNGLAAYLSSHVTGAEIVNCDFLKYEAASCHDVVVSNIPYYVMTDIMKSSSESFRTPGKWSSWSKMKLWHASTAVRPPNSTDLWLSSVLYTVHTVSSLRYPIRHLYLSRIQPLQLSVLRDALLQIFFLRNS